MVVIAGNVMITWWLRDGRAKVYRWIYKDNVCKEQWWAPNIRDVKFHRFSNFDFCLPSYNSFNTRFLTEKKTFEIPYTQQLFDFFVLNFLKYLCSFSDFWWINKNYLKAKITPRTTQIFNLSYIFWHQY